MIVDSRDTLLIDSGTVVALLKGKERVEALRAGDTGQVVLDHTPFYAESGGQVGDAGLLVGTTSAVQFEVQDTQKLGGSHAHVGKLAAGEVKFPEIGSGGGSKN